MPIIVEKVTVSDQSEIEALKPFSDAVLALAIKLKNDIRLLAESSPLQTSKKNLRLIACNIVAGYVAKVRG